MRTAPWTPAELAIIEEERLKWLAVGKSTDRVDKEAVTTTIGAMYRALKKKPPEIRFADGPHAALRLIAAWKAGFPKDESQLKVIYEPTWCWGAHESYWVGWYRCAERLGITFKPEDRKRLAWWETLARSCLWWWPFENGVVVCDRPTELHMESDPQTRIERLHCETGPAMAFLDGHKLYAWHGVRVPEHVILSPESLRPEHITQEPNAEVRRIMLERFGIDRYFDAVGLKPVQADDFGKLYKHTFPDGRALTVVRVVNPTPEPNGSYKEYVIPVPGTVTSAHEAVALTYGLEKKYYAPRQRT